MGYLPRRSNSRSTALRMKSDCFSSSLSADLMRASVPSAKRAIVFSPLILGRPKFRLLRSDRPSATANTDSSTAALAAAASTLNHSPLNQAERRIQ